MSNECTSPSGPESKVYIYIYISNGTEKRVRQMTIFAKVSPKQADVLCKMNNTRCYFITNPFRS